MNYCAPVANWICCRVFHDVGTVVDRIIVEVCLRLVLNCFLAPFAAECALNNLSTIKYTNLVQLLEGKVLEGFKSRTAYAVIYLAVAIDQLFRISDLFSIVCLSSLF